MVAELRKVVWPTQEQLVTYFIVVMVFVLVMMAIVSVLDLALRQARLRGLHRQAEPVASTATPAPTPHDHQQHPT